MRDYLTIAEAAEEARVSERTISRALHDRVRRLRCYRPGRRVIIAAEDLRAWLASHSAQPTIPSTLADTLSPTTRGLLRGLIDTAPTPGAEKSKRGVGGTTGSLHEMKSGGVAA